MSERKCETGHQWWRQGHRWVCADCGETAKSGDGVHHPCIGCGGPTEGPGHAALCDRCFETLRVVTEAEEIVEGDTRVGRFSKGELDKLERALFTAVAQSIDGRAHDMFFALSNLRGTRDLAEGRWVPGPGAQVITGVEEYLAELVGEGYRLLGIPARP